MRAVARGRGQVDARAAAVFGVLFPEWAGAAVNQHGFTDAHQFDLIDLLVFGRVDQAGTQNGVIESVEMCLLSKSVATQR